MKFMNRHLNPDAQAGAPTANAAGAAGSDDPAAETAEREATPSSGFSQADIDRILADRLGRQEKKLRREFEEQAEKQTEKELADAAEWQTLAEKRQAQIAKLETKVGDLEKHAETADKYGAALSTYVEKLSANVAPEIMALLENMDAADRLAWLTSNADKFAKADETQPEENGAAKRPLPHTPPPSSAVKMTPEERRKRAARTF